MVVISSLALGTGKMSPLIRMCITFQVLLELLLWSKLLTNGFFQCLIKMSTVLCFILGWEGGREKGDAIYQNSSARPPTLPTHTSPPPHHSPDTHLSPSHTHPPPHPHPATMGPPPPRPAAAELPWGKRGVCVGWVWMCAWVGGCGVCAGCVWGVRVEGCGVFVCGCVQGERCVCAWGGGVIVVWGVRGKVCILYTIEIIKGIVRVSVLHFWLLVIKLNKSLQYKQARTCKVLLMDVMTLKKCRRINGNRMSIIFFIMSFNED